MSSIEGSTGQSAADRIRLDTVVIGVDFSASSIAAADWVRKDLAPLARCAIVHALHVPRPPSFLQGAFPSRAALLASAREGATTRLERVVRDHAWGTVSTQVVEGRPEDVIAGAANEADADLVVVGEHARPRGMWANLGSTAEALVRCSPVPVLVARNPHERPPESILVAVDESDQAAALRWGRMLAGESGAALTILHIFQSVYLGIAQAVSGMNAARTLEHEQRRQTEAWLEQYVSAVGFGPNEATLRIESGDPATAIVAAQRGGDFDLLVIGSRGAGGVSRMLLGSVASGVVRGASCPVLVVRTR